MKTDSSIYDNKAKTSKIILLVLSPCLRVCKAGEVELMTSELSLGVDRQNLRGEEKGPTTMILTKCGFAIDHFVSYYPFKGVHL